MMGNRVFGCDDCQIVCPWNRFAKPSREQDFQPRHGLENAELAQMFLWDEPTFLRKTEGGPLRRAGYERWLRNLAVGLGNAPSTIPVIEALKARRCLAAGEGARGVGACPARGGMNLLGGYAASAALR